MGSLKISRPQASLSCHEVLTFIPEAAQHGPESNISKSQAKLKCMRNERAEIPACTRIPSSSSSSNNRSGRLAGRKLGAALLLLESYCFPLSISVIMGGGKHWARG